MVDTAQDGSRDVTLMAVERGAARVIVLDADELHLGALRELGRGVSSTVQVVHGVAGYTDSVRRVRRFASSRGMHDSCT